MNQTPDHARRIESMIRLGTVAELDHAGVRCKIKTGDLLTTWLPWLTFRAGTTRLWSPPTMGEQAVLLCPSGEPAAGIVLLGLNSDLIDAPSHSPDEFVIDFPDGARMVYNHSSSALTVTGIKTAVLEASESVTLDTPETHITGNVTIDGQLLVKQTATIMELLSYMAGLIGYGGDGGGSVIHGPLTQEGGDLSSNGKVLHTHVHGGVQTGPWQTEPPQ